MDSVPERIALNRGYGAEAILANIDAMVEDLRERGVPAWIEATKRATEAFKSWGATTEVIQLEELFNRS